MCMMLLIFVSAAPPAVPAPDSQQKASGSEVKAEDVLSNPGTYEEIGRKLKGKNYNDSDGNKDSDKFMERIRLIVKF